jgi:hypothetical protein
VGWRESPACTASTLPVGRITLVWGGRIVTLWTRPTMTMGYRGWGRTAGRVPRWVVGVAAFLAGSIGEALVGEGVGALVRQAFGGC